MSRRFVAMTETALTDLLANDLSELDLGCTCPLSRTPRCAITCSPARTARASSSPSRMSAAICSIAILTRSGTASALVSGTVV